MRFSLFLLLSLSVSALSFPGVVLAFEYDLGLRQRDIFFDKDQLIAGEPIRVYAIVKNYGENDISGRISFWQGPNLIGHSQEISTRAHGLADEVFVDWTVPEGSFNILAKIEGQDPQDDNPENDSAITGIFIPDIDTDSDGIGDKQDLDDDNDGMEDLDEAKLGTNPLKFDTDGDGVSDTQDEYPLDSSRFEKDKPEIVEVATVQEEESSPEINKIEFPSLEKNFEVQTDINEIKEEDIQLAEPVEQKPKRIETLLIDDIEIEVVQESWNTYGFSAQVNGFKDSEDIEFTWVFSDGYTDSGSEILREFPGSGDYQVTVHANNGANEHKATYDISISFFHLANPGIWISIALVSFIILGLVLFLLKTKKS